jgi:hypothetical protein
MSNISDEDDDGSKEEKEVEQSILTKEGYLTCIDASSNGQQLLDIIDLLPISAQCYGHSLTMNSIIKIFSKHPVFHEQCNPLFVVKHNNGKNVRVMSTCSSLSKEN